MGMSQESQLSVGTGKMETVEIAGEISTVADEKRDSTMADARPEVLGDATDDLSVGRIAKCNTGGRKRYCKPVNRFKRKIEPNYSIPYMHSPIGSFVPKNPVENKKNDINYNRETPLRLAGEAKINVPEVKIDVAEVKIDVPVVKIDVPVVKIDVPVVKIDVPVVKIDVPEVKIDVPEVKIDVPEVKIDVPEVKIDVPEVKIDVPEVKIDAPEVNDVPEVKIDAPEVKIDVPEVKIDAPEVKIDVPEVRKSCAKKVRFQVDDEKADSTMADPRPEVLGDTRGNVEKINSTMADPRPAVLGDTTDDLEERDSTIADTRPAVLGDTTDDLEITDSTIADPNPTVLGHTTDDLEKRNSTVADPKPVVLGDTTDALSVRSFTKCNPSRREHYCKPVNRYKRKIEPNYSLPYMHSPIGSFVFVPKNHACVENKENDIKYSRETLLRLAGSPLSRREVKIDVPEVKKFCAKKGLQQPQVRFLKSILRTNNRY